jgi:peptidoglycan hydrolase-like protein with peptidoglycan-binding domain
VRGTEIESTAAPALIPPPKPHARRRRTLAWLAIGVLVAGGAVGYAERSHFTHQAPSLAQSYDNSTAVAFAPVQRRDLSSQTQVGGTLGYAGTYSVLASGHGGIVTWLPDVGRVIDQGQKVYEADGAPVILLYGQVPVYRDLAEGNTGADVRQLNAALIALGYASSSTLSASSNTYTWATADAVEKLQAATGVTQDGRLHLGQAVFLPGPLRVTTLSATLGGMAQGPVVQGTSTARQVLVNLDAALQSRVKTGDTVTVTLPDTSTTQGTISSVGTVATAGSNGSAPYIQVRITLAHASAAGSWDQAPVQVAVDDGSVHDALVVPVTALLALSSGGYGVEVRGAGDARRLVAVTPGLFDDADGLVQVTGTGLQPGQQVAVGGQ